MPMQVGINKALVKQRQREYMITLSVGFFAAFGVGTFLSLILISCYIMMFPEDVFRKNTMLGMPVADGTSLYKAMQDIEIEKLKTIEEIALQERLDDFHKEQHFRLRRTKSSF
ncbi:MAG: hypothetical protein ACTHOO_09200 [Alcanivorax sp.]